MAVALAVELYEALPSELQALQAVPESTRPGWARYALCSRDHDDAAVAYLTVGTTETEREAQLLRWLEDQAPVPRIMHAGTTASGESYFVTAPLRGHRADRPEHHRSADEVVVAFGAGLAALHALPLADCPVGATTTERIAWAEQRASAGHITPSELSAAYARYEPARLLELLRSSLPTDSDDTVLVHGRYRCGNVLINGRQVTGFVDLGLGGRGDRYVDLAAASRSLVATFGPEALPRFFAAYGCEPSLVKLDPFVLLDELMGP